MKGKNLGRRIFRRSKLGAARVPAAKSTVVVLHEPSRPLDERVVDSRGDGRSDAWLDTIIKNHPLNLLSACFLPGLLPMEFSANTRNVIQECTYFLTKLRRTMLIRQS
jgi:hypothetical protein